MALRYVCILGERVSSPLNFTPAVLTLNKIICITAELRGCVFIYLAFWDESLPPHPVTYLSLPGPCFCVPKLNVKVAQLCPALCDPMDYTVHGILQARILERVVFPFSRGSLQPRSPALRADSLPAELPGKPKNTGVGSLSLLQWIFLTQESNWGLLHCRWILYQLSYQGNP